MMNWDAQEIIDGIERVDIFIIRLPLLEPFATSFATETHKEALLLRIYSGEFFGWGECVASPAPYYSYETNESTLLTVKKFLIPLIINKRNISLTEILNSFERIRGHNMAKATVENALLDLLARINNKPLYSSIGGKAKKIMSGISIGIKEDPDKLLESIAEALEKKYHRVKIKIKRGNDLEVIRAVRTVFPDIKLMADANGDYTVEDLDFLKQFDQFDLMMIEQPLPFDDIYFHSLVQKAIKTPVCLDESLKNFNDVKAAHILGSCRIVNIKQGRVGGILAARSIQDYCLKNNMPCWSGGMLETGIGRAFNLHLQTLPGFTLPGDTSETVRYFAEDIVNKPVVLDEQGYIDVPQGPGIGVEVVAEKLKKFTLHSETI